MVDFEDEIENAGAQIIWVLQEDRSFDDGTAQSCFDFMESIGAARGVCVGDGQTEPEAGTFANSPFTVGRGFDAIVTRSDMKIVWQASHGTPLGNENPDGAVVLEEIQRWVP